MNKSYTEIDGKFYQEVSVVMLPTEKASNLYLHHKDDSLHNIAGLAHQKGVYGGTNQFLYFLSDEEIKEGDWFLCTYSNTIHNILSGFEKKECCKKIIATTDSELGEHDSITISQGRFNNTYPTFKPLARPSNSFIEKFVSKWNVNRKIDRVLVEYEKHFIGWNEDQTENEYIFALKIAPDNTITIKPLIVKDSYSREEMENLLSNYGVDVLYAANNKQAIPYYIDWLKKQNL